MSEEKTFPDLHIRRTTGSDCMYFEKVAKGLADFEAAFTNHNDTIIQLSVRDEQHAVYGGVALKKMLNVIFLYNFWVDGKYRRNGIGTQILKHVEAIAAEQWCDILIVRTFSFHYQEFYLKNGFQILNHLKLINGYSLYHMSKTI